MFEKNMKISYLLDLYGALLDEHIISVMRAYYYDDLSLAEIATDEGISRQGVRHLIKKGEEKLAFFEEKLNLAEHYALLDTVSESLSEIHSSLLSDDDREVVIKRVESAIEIISKGNQDVR